LGQDRSPTETTVTFPIEAGKIREFAAAIMDDNPIYRSPEAAQGEGFADVPAPPTYSVVSSFFQEGTPLDMGLDMRYTLHAAAEFEYHAPVVAGDVLTGRSYISERYEKEGRRGGKMKFAVLETVYVNQRGEKVLTVRGTGLQTEGPVSHEK
jgi:peroxisomal enoyl-CoA hydratase 2